MLLPSVVVSYFAACMLFIFVYGHVIKASFTLCVVCKMCTHMFCACEPKWFCIIRAHIHTLCGAQVVYYDRSLEGSLLVSDSETYASVVAELLIPLRFVIFFFFASLLLLRNVYGYGSVCVQCSDHAMGPIFPYHRFICSCIVAITTQILLTYT